jgi:anthraniloyl-CoA monooxygenase
MKIGIIGGGPGGLYFALLMKQRFPSYRVCVFEQNPADATYGWGVVFSGRALSFLSENDPASYADIMAQMRTWDDQTIIHRDEKIRIDGSAYSGITRLTLLNILHEHCRRHGVDLVFNTRIADVSALADCDLIVGADGVNSVVRQQYAAQFQPATSFLTNKYIWYGTHQLFDTLSLIFRRYEGGHFVAHCYPYSATTSTFIVECDAETWAHAGFAYLSEAESRAYCERVFQDDLAGHKLLSNKSAWLNFKIVTNQRWSHQNIVLLGDALRTVHFSIGSGTRMALEDAIALYHAFSEQQDVEEAIALYEQQHRPSVEKMLDIAAHSYQWYENFPSAMALDPLPFVYGYMKRSGRIDDDTLRQRAPRFMARYEVYVASKEL